MTISAKVELFE